MITYDNIYTKLSCGTTCMINLITHACTHTHHWPLKQNHQILPTANSRPDYGYIIFFLQSSHLALILCLTMSWNSQWQVSHTNCASSNLHSLFALSAVLPSTHLSIQSYILNHSESLKVIFYIHLTWALCTGRDCGYVATIQTKVFQKVLFLLGDQANTNVQQITKQSYIYRRLRSKLWGTCD